MYGSRRTFMLTSDTHQRFLEVTSPDRDQYDKPTATVTVDAATEMTLFLCAQDYKWNKLIQTQTEGTTLTFTLAPPVLLVSDCVQDCGV